MKKIITVTIAILSVLSLRAQGRAETFGPGPDASRVIVSILVLGLLMYFILTVMTRIFEYRLKNKIIDKGIPENMISSILQKNTNESLHVNIKWFALLAGAGVGLTIVYYTLPLGVHSLAIMAFCISLSFLGYFFYLKKSDN